jgi:hypothetical protein
MMLAAGKQPFGQATLIPFYANRPMPVFCGTPIQMHFFIGGCDWYVSEFAGEGLCFGFVILNVDYENAECGYLSLEELKGIKAGPSTEIDRNLDWRVRPAKEVDKITHCRKGAVRISKPL